MILVGTSGFQYRDWVPVFYPRNLDPGSWLRYYSQRFGCCELSFTYYRIPEVTAIQEIIDETRGILPVVFRVPYRLAEEHPCAPDLARRFAAALWPLKDAGQLAASQSGLCHRLETGPAQGAGPVAGTAAFAAAVAATSLGCGERRVRRARR